MYSGSDFDLLGVSVSLANFFFVCGGGRNNKISDISDWFNNSLCMKLALDPQIEISPILFCLT